MSDPSKDTIYIDIDDEITTIIDKVRDSSHKVIALVLPKRAAVLQSVVNMKLLKRTADDEKKNIVLITSEAGLLPLAGSVGLYVAKTLQTKPTLPEAPELFADTDAIDEPVDVESEPTDFDPKEAADKSVGELATKSAAGSKTEPKTAKETPASANPLVPDETIDLNEDELEASGTIADSIAENKKDKKGKKDKKDKKLKVPNFIRFRRVLILFIVFLIIVIVGLVLLVKILPKATISIQTNNSDVNTNLTLTLSTATKTLDPTNLVVPATQQQVTKTNSQEVPTTGQENNGAQASGDVTMTACESSFTPPQQVPAGTGITANGLTFITQTATTFSNSGHPSGTCFSYNATSSTQVTAQQGGSQYNLGPTSFSIAGRSDVNASSATAFSGGTDSVVSIVAQADVNTATQKIAAQDTSTIKQELANDLQQAGLEPITATFTAGTPSITTSPAVGTQANNVTVTQSVNYTMLGVPQADLVTLVDNSVNSQINSSSQSILSNGVSSANISLLNQSSGQAQISLTATSTVGSELNVSTIKSQIVGKKSGDVQSIIKGYPGVQSVTVHFSPFWVSSVPSNTSKVDITILKASSS